MVILIWEYVVINFYSMIKAVVLLSAVLFCAAVQLQFKNSKFRILQMTDLHFRRSDKDVNSNNYNTMMQLL